MRPVADRAFNGREKSSQLLEAALVQILVLAASVQRPGKLVAGLLCDGAANLRLFNSK